MRGVLTSALLVCVAAAISGCAESDEPNDEQIAEFRSGMGGSWEDPNLPGNGDLTVFFGGHANVPGCDIWDIMSNDVQDAQTPNGDLIFTINGDEIVDANGTVQCVRSGNEFSEVVVRESDSEVVFSVLGPFIFDGALDLSGSWWQDLQELHQKLLYTFKGPDVYDRYWWHNDKLVTADVNIKKSSRMRKFTISSLIAGECGGPGLPDPPPDI